MDYLVKYRQNHFATEDVTAVAFAAYRANNNNLYTDKQVYDVELNAWVMVTTNKERMKQHLVGEQPLVVTEQDAINANDAKELVVDWCVTQTLQEQHISPFIITLKESLLQEQQPLSACGIIAYLPEQYATLAKKKNEHDRLTQLVYTSQWFGSVGQTIDFAITVLSYRYVRKFSCYFVFGYTEDGNCVSFFTGHESCTVSGSYIGKIKQHTNDSYRNNVKVTQVNYVKKNKLVDVAA